MQTTSKEAELLQLRIRSDLKKKVETVYHSIEEDRTRVENKRARATKNPKKDQSNSMEFAGKTPNKNKRMTKITVNANNPARIAYQLTGSKTTYIG